MWVITKDNGATVKINTEYIERLYPDFKRAITVSGHEINLSDDDYEELEKTMFPKRKSYAKDDTELAEYFNQLHILTGGKGSAIMTPQRKKKLTDLLKSMTKEQLIAAATNVGKNEWLQGDNPNHKRYGDIDYLLRPDKAAKYAEMSTDKQRKKLF